MNKTISALLAAAFIATSSTAVMAAASPKPAHMKSMKSMKSTKKPAKSSKMAKPKAKATPKS